MVESRTFSLHFLKKVEISKKLSVIAQRPCRPVKTIPNPTPKATRFCANPCSTIPYGDPLWSSYPTCQFNKFCWSPHRATMCVLVSLPPSSALWRGTRIRPGEMLQCDLCGILLRIVDVLSIVPEPRCDVLSLNCHCARPCCASA